MILPSMPDGLTAEFLTDLFRDIDLLNDDVHIVEVSMEQVGDGVGMMSEVSRVRLRYSGETDLSPTYVVKYPSQNETNREIAMSYKLYEREVRYFAELDSKTTAYSPRPYFTELAGDKFLIVMEDMGEYRVGDQAIGADLSDTEAAVDELAKLHATFWNDVQDLDWVPGIAGSYHADNMANLVVIGWPVMCEIFKDFLAPEIATRGEQFAAEIRGLQDKVFARPRTLLHGDFRGENVFFGQASHHRPIAIIDWQGPILGRGMVDVALFLGQSTLTEVRRANEDDLIERYAEGLTAAGVKNYTKDEAWADYELAMLYNWVYTGVVAGTLDVHNERAFAWMSQMVARHSTASLDLDVFRLIS